MKLLMDLTVQLKKIQFANSLKFYWSNTMLLIFNGTGIEETIALMDKQDRFTFIKPIEFKSSRLETWAAADKPYVIIRGGAPDGKSYKANNISFEECADAITKPKNGIIDLRPIQTRNAAAKVSAQPA